jgi:hypothetical protein
MVVDAGVAAVADVEKVVRDVRAALGTSLTVVEVFASSGAGRVAAGLAAAF